MTGNDADGDDIVFKCSLWKTIPVGLRKIEGIKKICEGIQTDVCSVYFQKVFNALFDDDATATAEPKMYYISRP